jgi:hypothetical protein
MSYARYGNSGDDAQLSLLRERLKHEVSARTGVDFCYYVVLPKHGWF